MTSDSAAKRSMRAYWDERARVNAPWYVDTSLSYDDPDMDQFWDAGRRITKHALEGSPVPPQHDGLAVEIGSGLGRICLALTETFERVIGIDISPEMVSRANELVNHPRVTFRVGDGRSLAGIATDSVDFVVSFTVFQHIPVISVIEGYIEEAGRTLRPGGVFAFQWNNMAGARRWAARRRAIGALSRAGLRQWRDRTDPSFLGSRVSLDNVRRAVDRGGMEFARVDRPGELFAWGWAVKRDRTLSGTRESDERAKPEA